MPFFKSQPDKQADDTKALTTPVFQDLFSVMGAAGQALCGGLGALHIDPTRLQELQQTVSAGNARPMAGPGPG